MEQTSIYETRPLRVSINRPHQNVSRLGIFFAIAAALYYLLFKHDVASAKVAALGMGSIGILLLAISWGYVRATSKEITARNIFQSTTVMWRDINRIVSIPWLGMLSLYSDESRVDLIPSYWSGEDKEELLQLLTLKLEQTGVQPYEQHGFR